MGMRNDQAKVPPKSCLVTPGHLPANREKCRPLIDADIHCTNAAQFLMIELGTKCTERETTPRPMFDCIERASTILNAGTIPVEVRGSEIWVQPTFGHADPAAHWRRRLDDGLAHDLGLVIAKAGIW